MLAKINIQQVYQPQREGPKHTVSCVEALLINHNHINNKGKNATRPLLYAYCNMHDSLCHKVSDQVFCNYLQAKCNKDLTGMKWHIWNWCHQDSKFQKLLLPQPFYILLGFVQDYPLSRYQKGKTNLDSLKQEIVSGSGISWAICKLAPMQIGTLPQIDNHASIPPLSFYRLDALLADQVTVSETGGIKITWQKCTQNPHSALLNCSTNTITDHKCANLD